MTTNQHHRTASIQRPITAETTRPTRRSRRRAADGTPGRGLPERPLPGRPGAVRRAGETASLRRSATPTGARANRTASTGSTRPTAASAPRATAQRRGSTGTTGRVRRPVAAEATRGAVRDTSTPTRTTGARQPTRDTSTPTRTTGARQPTRDTSTPTRTTGARQPTRDERASRSAAAAGTGATAALARTEALQRTGTTEPPARRRGLGRKARRAAAATTEAPATRRDATPTTDAPAARRAPSTDAAATRRPAAAGPTTPSRGTTGPGRGATRPRGAATDRSAPTTRATRKAAARGGATTEAERTGTGKRPSALRDVTRPIARDSRMTQRRPLRIGYGVIAGAIGLALVAALVVLPVRRWWNQRADLADRRNELDILERANDQLSREVAALNTPEGIEVAARDELNYAYPGEERTRIVGDTEAPIALPPGYPYDVVSGILAVRASLATAPPTGPADASDPAASDPATTAAATDPPEPTIAAPPDNAIAPAP